MNILISFYTIILIGGCSLFKTKPKDNSIDKNRPQISKNAMLNLVRTSYIKGCVEAKTLILKDRKLYPFSKCTELGNLHATEIESILYSDDSIMDKTE
ncbi:hypothetical protein N9N67_10035 [Bacteriovoracaceae bacterium]|nr:hypothetical protein [Bacteriovoracaceae bacterium]